MRSFLENHLLWIKALHIIFVTFWMAALFYLPRLFVYHADVAPGSEADGLFQTMERRLSLGILMPSMVISLILGFFLLSVPGLVNFSDGWLHLKLLCVLLLIIYYVFLSRVRKAFISGKNQRSSKFYRKINEIAPVLFLIIVVMVVIKPF